MIIETAEIESPIGTVAIGLCDGILCAVKFVDRCPYGHEALERRFDAVEYRERREAHEAIVRLRAYFGGEIDALDALEVDAGGTPFQRRMWARLREVPPGTTVSYRQLAEQIGAPTAARAVGAANGANPIAIVIPCHRVIRTDGDFGGYGGGGERKRWLLAHEHASLRDASDSERATAVRTAAMFGR